MGVTQRRRPRGGKTPLPGLSKSPLPVLGKVRPGRSCLSHHRRRLVVLSAVFASSLAVFASTVSPYIAGGDSGELASCACTLGVPHPPGYPLFTLLYHITGSSAAHFNLLSCVLSAAAIAVLSDAMLAAFDAAAIALFGPLVFAWSPTTWQSSGQVEVFPLHHLFLALLLRLTLWVWTRPTRLRASVCAFVSALACCNQHTSVLYIMPVAGLLLLQHNHLQSPAALLTIGGSFVCGLLPYAWLVYASAKGFDYAWGDLTTVDGFLRHVLRREYGTFQLGADSIATTTTSFSQKLGVYLQHLSSEFLFVPPPLAVIGVVSFLRGRRGSPAKSQGLAVAAAFLLYVVVFHALANLSVSPLFVGVMARFWPHPDMLLCFLAMAGLAAVSPRPPWSAAVPALLAGVQLGRHYPSAGVYTDDTVETFGRSILRSMPKDALLFAYGDININTLKYLQACRGVRPDLDIVPVSHLTYSWFNLRQLHNYRRLKVPNHVYDQNQVGGYTTAELMQANVPDGQVFACGQLPVWPNGDKSHNLLFERWTHGMCGQIFAKGEAPSNVTASLLDSFARLPAISRLSRAVASSTSWEHAVHHMVDAQAIDIFSKLCGEVEKEPGNEALLRAAARLAETLLDDAMLKHQHQQQLPNNLVVYRDAGLVLGLYSRWHRPAEQGMLRAYRFYLDRIGYFSQGVSGVSAASWSSSDHSAAAVLTTLVNPHTRRRIRPLP